MIGPYLAVIFDSFRAALASRVLWVAFFAIWALLAALAPIGYREEFTTTFRWNDFENGTQMKHLLGRALVDPAQRDAAVGRLAAGLPEDLRRPLRRVGQGEDVRIPLRDFAVAFNELIRDEAWFDADTWSETLRLRELRELDETPADQLTEALRQRRVRLRIEAALPGVFRSRASRSILFTYAGYDFPADIAVDKTQFVTLINQWVMPTLINWLLGFVLVFLGILVTASIIPDMLQPGSLHLLLSKPVSRPLLLLSKFLGGCAFMLLCVTQLVIGLYLITGFRLDLWNARLLWCIPVSVFLFSVFYSVSVVAGLRWRSSILAIGITCIFGAVCLTVGVIGGLFDSLVTRPQSLAGVAVAGDTLIGSTRGGGLVRYDRDAGVWSELIKSNAMGRDRVLPPVKLDPEVVLTANVSGGRFNPYGSGSLDLLMLRANNLWDPQPGIRLPPATIRVLPCGQSRLLAVTTGGLFIARRDRIVPVDEAIGDEAIGDQVAMPVDEGESRSEKSSSDPAGSLATWISGFMGEREAAESPFVPILPPRMAIVSPSAIVPTADGESILIASRGRLVRLASPADTDKPAPWRLAAERLLEGEPSRPVVLAQSGAVGLVARADEPLRFFEVDTLRPIGESDLPSGGSLTAAIGLGDSGRFVVLTGNGRGRVVTPPRNSVPSDDSSPTETTIRSDGIGESLPIGEIETATFDASTSSLIVAHHVDRITWLDADRLQVRDQIRPSISGWRLVDRYVVAPLRLIVPQTGELGQTVTAIISGKAAVTVSETSGAEEELVRYRIARPVLSCAGFIVVMLTIGCIYFSRRDF